MPADPTSLKLTSIYPPPTSPGSIIGIASQPLALPLDNTFEDVTSANDHLIVHDYAPTSAVFALPVLLTVLLTCVDVVAKDAEPVQLRLNVDGTYVPTSVRPGPKSALELHAMLSVDFLACSDPRPLLSIHAYRNDEIFDSCDFGFLKALDDQVIKYPTPTLGRLRKRLYHDFESSDEDYVSNIPSRYKKVKRTTHVDAPRPKRLPTLLVVKGDLSAVADFSSWSKAEEYEGRRLVLFSPHQTGHRIQLSLRPITRCELSHQIKGVVVSCLRPPGESNFYITSVDILRLITFLISPRTKYLSIDERNRNRRSLEGFHPITVKKNHPDSIGLFNYLTSIPEPRPMTIAKDIKIYRWCFLKAALVKILAKYDYDPDSNDLFENGMSRKVSYPPLSPNGHTGAPTNNHDTANETPRTSARRPIYSIRFVVPKVPVQIPDNSRLASGHSRAPSPSGPFSGVSDPPKGTIPATRVKPVFSSQGSEMLRGELLKRLHQRPSPRHQEDDNYDDDGDGSDIVYTQDRFFSVQDTGSASPSQASGLAADEPIIQTDPRAESPQEHDNLSYSYDLDTPLLETKLGRYSPDDTADVSSRSLHQISRPHTIPPTFRHVLPRSRTAFKGTDTGSFIRVPTHATSGELESSKGGMKNFVGLFLAVEDHQQLAIDVDVDVDDEDCFSGGDTGSV